MLELPTSLAARMKIQLQNRKSTFLFCICLRKYRWTGAHRCPTFAIVCFWDWCKSGKFLLPGWKGVGHIWSMSSQFTKYGEWGEFTASVWHPKAERFSASGVWPLTHDEGLCHDPARGSTPNAHYGIEIKGRVAYSHSHTQCDITLTSDVLYL